MAVLNEGEIRTRAKRRAKSKGFTVEDELNSISRRKASRYDVFLSQTIKDAEIVLGVYDLLTEIGYIVFCDWISAPEADRTQVTPENAEYIRNAMSVSDAFLFLDTESSDHSTWMCWELGWFDGAKGHVAVLPVLQDEARSYRGREFLGLYPYIEIDSDGQLKVVRPYATNKYGITILEAPNSREFDDWRNDTTEFMRPRNIENLR